MGWFVGPNADEMKPRKCRACGGTDTVELDDGPPHYGPCRKCRGSGERG